MKDQFAGSSYANYIDIGLPHGSHMPGMSSRCTIWRPWQLVAVQIHMNEGTNSRLPKSQEIKITRHMRPMVDDTSERRILGPIGTC